MSKIWLFVVLLVGFYCIQGRRSLFDGTDLPRLKDTDVIELYHLRSFPSLILDTDVGLFSTQTSGLALRSTTTENVVVLQYKPKNYSTSFLPRLISSTVNDSIVAGLTWDKRAEIVYHDHIDTSLWQQSTFMARINGVVYKNYVTWLDEYIKDHSIFRPQSICSNEFDGDSCFILSDTWDTFLADSFRLFAALSVRMNAIIPPRGTELKIISASEPVIVRIANLSSQYIDRRDQRRRHFAQDDDQPHHEMDDSPSFYPDPDSPNDENESASMSSSTSTSANNDQKEVIDNGNFNDIDHNNTLGNATISSVNSTHRTLLSSFTLQYHKFADEISNTNSYMRRYSTISDTSQNDNKDRNNNYIENIPVIHADAVLHFYDTLLSCMQDFQLLDYATALKNCVAEDVAYIHIEGDLYWEIKPRYPFISLREYLQDIPPPQFRTDLGVDVVDWSLVGFFVFAIVMGCLATLYQIKIWELGMQACRRCTGSSFPFSSFTTSSSSAILNDNGAVDIFEKETYFSPSRRERDNSHSQRQRMSQMDRLWGVFINYKGRGQQPPVVQNTRSNVSNSSLEYSKLAQMDEDEEEGLEMM